MVTLVGFEPTISAVTGRRALRAAPRGLVVKDTFCKVVADGLEPSLPGCRPGVVAAGPRDCFISQAEAVGLEPTSGTRPPPVFETGSSSSRMTSVRRGRIVLAPKRAPRPRSERG